MKHIIEACLFATAEAIKPVDFARRMELDLTLVEQEFATLWAEYAERESSGVTITRIAGGYQMVTRPEIAPEIGKFIAAATGRSSLSRAAMETLAIVAYRQPVTTSEIEAVRGVSVDGVLKTLTERNLLIVAGRKNVPGRPLLYATTEDFLHHFGIDTLAELPPLDITDPPTEDETARHMVEQAVGID